MVRNRRSAVNHLATALWQDHLLVADLRIGRLN
jgi:hypothetical protein